jgi:putative hemolysin
MRGIHVVPGSREVEEVLADFKQLKEHMAIVLDEYGGTAGLVTMEDLLEEIVGEILDEYDDTTDLQLPRSAGGEALVPGATSIREVNDEYDLTVPDDDYTTIGGYVFGALGRLPVAQVSSSLYLVPVFAFPIAWVWMGEVPGELSLIGGAITLVGVLLVQLQGR